MDSKLTFVHVKGNVECFFKVGVKHLTLDFLDWVKTKITL